MINGALIQADPLWFTMLLCIPSSLHHDVGIHAEEMPLSLFLQFLFTNMSNLLVPPHHNECTHAWRQAHDPSWNLRPCAVHVTGPLEEVQQGQVVTLNGPEWADPGHHVTTWASCHSRSLAPEAGSWFLNAPHLDPMFPNIKTWSQHLISYYAYYYMHCSKLLVIFLNNNNRNSCIIVQRFCTTRKSNSFKEFFVTLQLTQAWVH